MPIFNLKVNVSKDKANPQFLKELSSLLSKTSTKPESLCQVTLTTDVLMTFGGTTEPTAFAEYICIGVIGGDYNAEITRQFASLAEKSLGISKDRFYIKFVDPRPADIGTHGTNCAIHYGI